MFVGSCRKSFNRPFEQTTLSKSLKPHRSFKKARQNHSGQQELQIHVSDKKSSKVF